MAPPPAALGVSAAVKIRERAAGMAWAWQISTTTPPVIKNRAIMGTSASLTRPMRPIPPRITTPVKTATTTPTGRRCQEKAASRAVAMEFACTSPPPVRVAAAQKSEKKRARVTDPTPRTMYSMGPPSHRPCRFRKR
ncbi:hypothetical protein SDC9_173034 [bioreactor metagenome]|uniref:Uncharacterized protein n=1 Tax=bioreactor metagenome TaxID=1076179 RepID=A0A645GI08_9ZZZZ